MKELFQSQGVNLAFDSQRADFSGISKTEGDGLFISDILHKAMIDVSESGTVAAAATAVRSSVASVPPAFSADHPFLYMIRDNQTGLILFLGRLERPI